MDHNVRFSPSNNAFHDTLQNHDPNAAWRRPGVFGLLARVFDVVVAHRQFARQRLLIR